MSAVKNIRFLLLALLLASCASGGSRGPSRAPLLDPAGAAMTAPAPATYQVRFDTSRGEFLIEVERAWAPNGADRFYNLVRHGFYDGAYFFRVLSGFVAQFGVPADPGLASIWRDQRMRDDPFRESNRRGTVTFAHAGPNTRSMQVFINLGENERLDPQGFVPFGRVVEGMEVVDSLYAGYGDGNGLTPGPDQNRIMAEGSAYLQREYPRLDVIRSARVVEE